VPSNPKTLLRMIPVPPVRSCAPAGMLSGLPASPFPRLMFDDDLGGVGNPTNCTLRFAKVPPLGNSICRISGVTRDGSGNPLGNCKVKIFTTTDDTLRYTTVSDAAGKFSIDVPSNGWSFYGHAYLAGAPDVAGATINNMAVALI
jgi:hypothetical protein